MKFNFFFLWQVFYAVCKNLYIYRLIMNIISYVIFSKLLSFKFRTPQVEQILGYAVGWEFFFIWYPSIKIFKKIQNFSQPQNLKSETFQAIKEKTQDIILPYLPFF